MLNAGDALWCHLQAIGIEAAPKFQKASSVGNALGSSNQPSSGPAKSNSVSAISSMAMDDAGGGGGADWGDDFELSGDDNWIEWINLQRYAMRS